MQQASVLSVRYSWRKSSNEFLSLVRPTKLLGELDIKQDVEITARFSRFLRTNTCIISRAHAFTLDNLDRARRRDLVDRNEQVATIHSSHFDWSALKCVIQSQFVSVDEAIAVFAFEVGSVGARWARNLLETDLEVSGW